MGMFDDPSDFASLGLPEKKSFIPDDTTDMSDLFGGLFNNDDLSGLMSPTIGAPTAGVNDGAIAAGVGGVGKLFATMSQGILAAGNAKLQGDFAAQQFEFNQRMAEFQVDDAIWRGRRAAQERKVEGRRAIGSQRASLAAQGVDVNEGTAADIQEDTATVAELDAITIKSNAYREALGMRIQSTQYSFLSRHASAAGTNASRQTGIGAFQEVTDSAFRTSVGINRATRRRGG